MNGNDRFGRGPRFGPKAAPVNVGDELTVHIEAVGAKGDGIAKKDGFVLFVPSAKEGTDVKVKITRVLRKLGFAEIIGEGSAADVDAPAEETEEAEPEEDFSGDDTEDFGDEESTTEEETAEEEPEAEEETKEETAEEEPEEKKKK